MLKKLTMDPGCARKRVFTAHTLDEITQATINRTPCLIS